MNKVTFTIPDVDGEFCCDADVVRSYRTAKKLVKAQEDATLAFEVMEQVFMGHDEEYVDRVGGGVEDITKLIVAAVEACGAKNSQASPSASKSTKAK